MTKSTSNDELGALKKAKGDAFFGDPSYAALRGASDALGLMV
jgi:hypothetical protein